MENIYHVFKYTSIPIRINAQPRIGRHSGNASKWTMFGLRTKFVQLWNPVLKKEGFMETFFFLLQLQLLLLLFLLILLLLLLFYFTFFIFCFLFLLYYNSFLFFFFYTSTALLKYSIQPTFIFFCVALLYCVS